LDGVVGGAVLVEPLDRRDAQAWRHVFGRDDENQPGHGLVELEGHPRFGGVQAMVVSKVEFGDSGGGDVVDADAGELAARCESCGNRLAVELEGILTHGFIDGLSTAKRRERGDAQCVHGAC
jgi:hypothetical protein